MSRGIQQISGVFFSAVRVSLGTRVVMDGIGNFSTWFRFVFLLLLAAGAYGISAAEPDSASAGREVVEIEINGSINPSTVDYLESGLSAARDRNASALLVLLDTPGGLLNSTKDMVKMILNSEIPVIVYVHPRGASATSAGVFITLSAHVAAMAPGTSIGAAHPVTLGRGRQAPGKPGEKKKEEETASEKTMNEKVENYAASFIESIAKERGRNAKWAVESVRKSSSITAGEALEKKVIDLVSPDTASLLSTVDGRKVSVAGRDAVLRTAGARASRVEMNLRQKVVNVLSTPDIAFLLLSLGSLGIFLEFYNPGMIFPGVAGLISLLVGFVSLQILPFNYAGLALIFVAFALIISEIYVASYGLLSLAGVACLVFGGLLLFDAEGADLAVNRGVIAAAAGTIGLFSAFIVYLATRSLVIPVQGGFEGMLGQRGEVVSWSGAAGKIYIQGEYWDAAADRQFAPGDRVRVTESTGDLELRVEAEGGDG